MAIRQRYDLLGVTVDAMTIDDVRAAIQRSIESGERHIIANHNLHSLYLHHHDPLMRAYYAKATYVHVDGMPLILFARLFGLPLHRAHRLTYLDLAVPIFEMITSQKLRAFYLGGKPGVAARGANILRETYPGLNIQTAHGYFDVRPQSRETQQVIATINDFQPHILFVGMGMPRQEQWIVAHLSQLHANIIFNVGAYMDYITGEVPTPPRWTGRMGLEWLYRLCSEPGRLWRRYLLEPWFLLGVLFNGDVPPR
jgi:N-acetylglucosaminyldiphosphoundecaprenol N-acetyl-beta-D-mannosaminyltransferase